MRDERLLGAKSAVALLLALLANGTYAAGTVSLMYGGKSLDKSDWEPVESQNELGFGIEIQEPAWPVALVASYLNSDDSAAVLDPDIGITVSATGKTTELAIGARKYLAEERTRFFIEGGVVSVSAELEIGAFGWTISDTDSAIGYWFGAGVDAKLDDSLSIGLLGRVSDATVRLYGSDGDAGGSHFNVFAAYHF